MINSANTTTDIVTYDAFGNITSESNSSFGDRYKYTGREFDNETGLQSNRARYIDASTGRWTGEDPSGFAAGDVNLYRYVGNDPISRVDPSGLKADFLFFAETVGKVLLKEGPSRLNNVKTTDIYWPIKWVLPATITNDPVLKNGIIIQTVVNESGVDERVGNIVTVVHTQCQQLYYRGLASY